MSSAMPTRRHGRRLFATVLTGAVITALTLAPRALVAPARGAFMQFMDAVTSPLLVGIPYGDAERLLNLILFVPLGATIALLLSRGAWPLAILAGWGLSTAVEYAQGSIPGRVSDVQDVVWNTLGAAIGVVVVTVPRLIAATARSRQRGSETRT
jgi:hypothetical protein